MILNNLRKVARILIPRTLPPFLSKPASFPLNFPSLSFHRANCFTFCSQPIEDNEKTFSLLIAKLRSKVEYSE